jgi:hypothetical protein
MSERKIIKSYCLKCPLFKAKLNSAIECACCYQRIQDFDENEYYIRV